LQAAGKDHATGKKSYLLEEFERKYKKMFLDHMKEYKSINMQKQTTRWRPEKS
jgi:tryptophan 2,3-dioxygenase